MTKPDDRPTLPVPPAELAELDFFTGTWDAEGTFHATPFTAGKPIRMVIEVTSTHRGFWRCFASAELPDVNNPNPLNAT